MNKELKNELWNLLTWIGMFNDPKIKIVGVENKTHELCFINEHAGYILNFELNDINSIKGLCNLCCTWANDGVDIKIDNEGYRIENPGRRIYY